MLRVIPSTSSEGAKSYYTQGLSREDYYTQENEIVGAWGGLAAEHLNLSGQVTQDAFHALCDNVNPATGEALTVRQKGARRVGFDINFHCPKSVSLYYSQTKDGRVLDAFREAVRVTMCDMETGMKTRVRTGGKNEDRHTGNMAWAEFVHFTARPVDGVPDPHLHAHCFAFNATFDHAEHRWKAGQFGDIKRDAPYYEACFHSRLAASLRGLGFGIERTASGWELQGLASETLQKFSRRTIEIEKIAEDLGLTSASAKDKLGAKTRRSKKTAATAEEIQANWNERLSPEERARIADLAAGRFTPGEVPSVSSDLALDFALSHSFERSSVIPQKMLFASALRYGIGQVSVGDVEKSAQRKDLIVKEIQGQNFATTLEVWHEEKQLLDFVRKGRGRCAELNPRHRIEDGRLNEGQRAAVRHVLTSSDRVTGIRGAAGSGKTTLMQEAARGLEAGGHRLFVFAPTSEARDVLKGEGFAGAETVQQLLVNSSLQEKLRGGVMWVDEAGLLSSKDSRQLFRIAEAQNCRVVLQGDTRQHHAVERGDALRLLEREAGLRTAHVSEIMRQRGAYKEAIQSFAAGEIETGFAKLEAMGAVRQIDSEERYKQLAKDYLRSTAKGKTALVVSPTHAEGEKVTVLVRAKLAQDGKLGEERTFAQHRRLNLTEAERSDPHSYAAGQTVQILQNLAGFRRGEHWTVSKREGALVHVQNREGIEKTLPLEKSGRFDVYETRQMPVAVGDRLRITQNGFTHDRKHRLNNGAAFEVAGFTPEGNLQLSNGWILDRNFGNLAHGYCTTSHASQGKTVDHVFIAQSSVSFTASSREQFYVSASRARQSVTVYTDDKQGLLETVTASSLRASASDLVKGHEPAPEDVVRQQRGRGKTGQKERSSPITRDEHGFEKSL